MIISYIHNVQLHPSPQILMENFEVCQGEEWVLTCTGHSATHRWRFEKEGSDLVEAVYTSRDTPGNIQKGLYDFTLVSATNNWFESTVSTVLINAMNNTVAECSDTISEESETIRIAG